MRPTTFQRCVGHKRARNGVNQHCVLFLSCEQVHEEYKDLLVLMAYKAHLVLLEQLLLLMDSL